MSYYGYLWRMLEPLGVYSEGGYSGAELKALGAAMDKAAGVIGENLLEMIPMTALNEGLKKTRSLYPFHSAPETPEDIRAALKTLCRVDHECFTESAMEETLSYLGLNLGITVEAPEWVTVVFREQLTKDMDIVQALYLVELVLPAHIYIECALRYLDGDTGELVNEKKPLRELRNRTKAEWDSLMG